MQRRMFFMGLVATLATTLNATISRALVWSLVTQEEFDREVAESRAAGRLGSSKLRAPAPPAAPGAPKIEIKQPDLKRPIKVPVTIIVRFLPEPGATIVVSSFRAAYGAFIKLDITDKIKANAKLDGTGLFAEDVKLPAGKHNVTISIADDRGRVATQAIEITVS